MSRPPFVYITDIAEKLHVSRNYIRTVMLPHIRHEKTAQYRVQVDEMELRQWLMDNCEFSRQTRLVPISEDLSNETNANDMSRRNVPPCNLRKELPFQYVKPFDFWDLPILFPNDDRFAHAELFYRAMYACGAIKIKLGQRKSMFYAPELTDNNLTDAGSFSSPYGIPNLEMRKGAKALTVNARLCRAEDEREEGSLATNSSSGAEQISSGLALSIGIRGKDSEYVEEAVTLLNERFRRINVRYYNNGKAAQVTIPQDVFGKRK